MTPQKAIEIITNAVQGDGTKVTAEQDEALAIIQRAVEKQNPQRVFIDNESIFVIRNKTLYCCPKCRSPYLFNTRRKYCGICGQALDWSK